MNLMESAPKAETFKKLVDESLDKAYEDAAAELDIDAGRVYLERQCERVSETLARELNLRGVSAIVHQYKGWDIKDHDFVLAEFNEEKWAIDPTWQQFLLDADDSKPKALICPVVELETCLMANGIPTNKLHIWKI